MANEQSGGAPRYNPTGEYKDLMFWLDYLMREQGPPEWAVPIQGPPQSYRPFHFKEGAKLDTSQVEDRRAGGPEGPGWMADPWHDYEDGSTRNPYDPKNENREPRAIVETIFEVLGRLGLLPPMEQPQDPLRQPLDPSRSGGPMQAPRQDYGYQQQALSPQRPMEQRQPLPPPPPPMLPPERQPGNTTRAY